MFEGGGLLELEGGGGLFEGGGLPEDGELLGGGRLLEDPEIFGETIGVNPWLWTALQRIVVDGSISCERRRSWERLSSADSEVIGGDLFEGK